MKKILMVLLVLLLLSGWFYWFQWRPSEIRKECGKDFQSYINEHGDYLNNHTLTSTTNWLKLHLDNCLQSKGLK